MNAQALKEYQWKNRVILLFSPSAEQEDYRKQLALFKEHEKEMKERDIALFHIFESEGKNPKGERLSPEAVQKLRKQYAPNAANLQCLLIGKDGGKKLSELGILSIKKLFATIDAMPMRQVEMHRNKK